MRRGRERRPALGCDWLVLSVGFPDALALPGSAGARFPCGPGSGYGIFGTAPARLLTCSPPGGTEATGAGKVRMRFEKCKGSAWGPLCPFLSPRPAAWPPARTTCEKLAESLPWLRPLLSPPRNS